MTEQSANVAVIWTSVHLVILTLFHPFVIAIFDCEDEERGRKKSRSK